MRFLGKFLLIVGLLAVMPSISMAAWGSGGCLPVGQAQDYKIRIIGYYAPPRSLVGEDCGPSCRNEYPDCGCGPNCPCPNYAAPVPYYAPPAYFYAPVQVQIGRVGNVCHRSFHRFFRR